MADYSIIVNGIPAMAADLVAETNRRAQGRSILNLTNNNVAALPAKHKATVDAVNAFILAEPNSNTAKLAKDQVDRIIAEFQTLKAAIQADVAALPE